MFKTIWKWTPWVIAFVAILSALWGWYHPQPLPQGQTEYVEAEIPETYKDAPKQKMETKECLVTVITKTEYVNKWPDWFSGDPNQQLTAIGLVKPYKGETECASIINLQTGDSRIVTRQLPVPLFGFENRFRAGGFIGMNGGFALDADWTFARGGNWYGSLGGVIASSGGQTVYVPGVGMHYEW